MTFRYFLLGAFTLLLFAEPASAQCPHGWSVNPANGHCILPGYTPCDNFACGPGRRCIGGGRCTGGVAGPRCGRNNTCAQGEACTPWGGCFNPRYQFVCGNQVCMVGFDYAAFDPCTPCMDDRTLCLRPSTPEKADQNLAACTRIINNRRSNRNDLARAYQARCVEWLTKRDFHRAIDDCNQSLKLDPGYHGAYNSRGSAYEALGDINKAIADYRKAASLGLDDAQKNLMRLRVR